MDQWAELHKRALGVETGGRYDELNAARNLYNENRAAQVDLLNQIAQRRSQVPGRTTATLNQAVEQLAAASDPRAQLAQLRGVAPGLGKAAMQHATAEGLGNLGQVAGGYGQLRGQGLGMAGIEQGIFGNDVATQLAKEALAQKVTGMAEQDIAGMSAAELALARIQAGAPNGAIDFAADILPALLNASSAAAGAYSAQPRSPGAGGQQGGSLSNPVGSNTMLPAWQNYPYQQPMAQPALPIQNPAPAPPMGPDTSNALADYLDTRLSLNYW
jgi:hypothetical protein